MEKKRRKKKRKRRNPFFIPALFRKAGRHKNKHKEANKSKCRKPVVDEKRS